MNKLNKTAALIVATLTCSLGAHANSDGPHSVIKVYVASGDPGDNTSRYLWGALACAIVGIVGFALIGGATPSRSVDDGRPGRV